METIEELRQSNAKLTERLNNAAKFFREQKAQIEALTKENEELKQASKDESSDLLEIKEQLAASNAACADMEKAIRKDLEDIEKLKKENNELKSDYTLLNNEYLNNENKLEETLAANKELVELNKKLNLKIDECSAELKIRENVSESHEALKLNYAALQYKYEELEKKYETAVKGYEEHRLSEEAYEDDLNKQLNQYELKLKDQEDINKRLNGQIKDLEEMNNHLGCEIDNYKVNEETFKNEIKVLTQSNNAKDAEIISFKKQISEVQEALNNAENVIETINTAVNYHAETAARKISKENKPHRIGDEHVMGENIGI